MKDLALFSKEQFTDFFLPTTDFSNGALITSYTFGRDNFNTDVYVNLRFERSSGATGVVKPILYRGYLSGSTIIYDRFEYEMVTTSGQDITITLPYKSLTNQDYINYRVEFECVGAISSLTVSEVGLIFQGAAENKGIIGTSNRSISFSSSRRQDINQNFTTFQNYTKTVNYNALTNRNNLDRIVNILENPYQLRDIKTRCNKEVDIYGFDFDGATNILAYTNPTINAFNSEYSFTVKKGDSGTFSYLFKGGASGGITSFDVFFADVNTLRTTFRYGGAVVGSVSMESINSFNVGELLNVRIVFATVSLQSKVSLYIDNILQDEVFLPVAITSLSYNLVENQSVYGFSYPWLFGYYTESIISNFIVYSDGLKVFEETFNKITKGTIIGIEQYEAIGTEEITVVDIDNSTRLLTLTNLSVNYIGSNTQYIDLGLQNLEEI